MRVYLVEDDPITCEVLQKEVIKRGFQVVGVSNSVTSAIKDISNTSIDLCLADIQLADGNAFEIFTSLASINFSIIFITAYEEYALKAIKLSALDYIIKPIDFQEFHQAIDRFLNKNQVFEHQLEQINIARQTYTHDSLERIMLLTSQKYIILDLKQILFITSTGNYSTFHVENGNRYVSSKPLHYYEELLKKSNFLRIHQKYLINIGHIKSIIRKRLNMFVEMSSGEILPISKMKKKDFLKYFYY